MSEALHTYHNPTTMMMMMGWEDLLHSYVLGTNVHPANNINEKCIITAAYFMCLNNHGIF